MDNKRGVEASGAKGEVVDMNAGVAEGFGGGEMARGNEAGIGERIETKGGGAASQGMTRQPIAAAGADDSVTVDGVNNAQSDLVNLTTQDGEKIEKVWVEKVKDVMKETKDNPKKREDDIFEVKKDFIRKRFGREIGGGK